MESFVTQHIQHRLVKHSLSSDYYYIACQISCLLILVAFFKIVNGDCFVMDTSQKNMSINDLTHPADFGLLNLFLFICFFPLKKFSFFVFLC